MDDDAYMAAWREPNPPVDQLIADPRFPDCGVAALYAATLRGRPAAAPPQLPGGLFLASTGPWTGQRILPLAQQLEVAHLCSEAGLTAAAELAARWCPDVSPLPSLFTPEASYTRESVPFEAEESAEDPAAGIVRITEGGRTLIATLCGQGTSMGYLRSGDVALQAYGPQRSPIGDCSRFGIVNPWCEKSPVHKPDLLMRDSGFILKGTARVSGGKQWMAIEYHYSDGQLHLKVEPLQEPVPILFYAFAKSCTLGGRTLHHPSLEQIKGPAAEIELKGETGSIQIKSPRGQARAIPLSGGDHFWGATFLIAYEPGCCEWLIGAEDSSIR